jgi:hypothetical protein
MLLNPSAKILRIKGSNSAPIPGFSSAVFLVRGTLRLYIAISRTDSSRD